MTVKNVLINELSKIKDNNIALLLSGGNGSASLLFTLLDLGKNVHAYTFHLEGNDSTDLIKAKELVRKYNLDFTQIPLPTDIDSLKQDCLYLINEVGCYLKTDVECCFALNRSIPFIKEKVVVCGLGDDIYFGLSKRAQIHYKDSVSLMDKHREDSLIKYGRQLDYFKNMAGKFNIQVVAPYQSKRMFELFKGKSYVEINKPKQKQWILDTYPSNFSKIKCYHSDLQKGDSKIADNFTQLLNSDWNLKNYKRTDGIYNSIKRGEIKC